MNYILATLLVLSFVSLIGVRFAPRTGPKRYIWLVCCLMNLATALFLAIRTYRSTEELKHIRGEIAETKTALEPDSLAYDTMLVEDGPNGLTARIRFKSRKDQPFGILRFTVRLPVGQTARILDIFADGLYQLGGKGVENDGGVAWISFAPATMTTIPTLVVRLTDSTPLRIEGNHLNEPIVLEMVKAKTPDG